MKVSVDSYWSDCIFKWWVHHREHAREGRATQPRPGWRAQWSRYCFLQ